MCATPRSIIRAFIRAMCSIPGTTGCESLFTVRPAVLFLVRGFFLASHHLTLPNDTQANA